MAFAAGWSVSNVHLPRQCFAVPLQRRGQLRLSSCKKRARRLQIRMIGPMLPNFGSSNFFRSEIIQEEVTRLHRDHAALGELGLRYKTFDKAGKLKFIEANLELVDRWLILLQRFRLSEEFQCQKYVKDLEVQLNAYGLTIDSLVQNTKTSLEMMRKEAENE